MRIGDLKIHIRVPRRQVKALQPEVPLYDRMPTVTTWHLRKQPETVKVIVIDEVLDERGKPRSAIWWAEVLVEAIQHLNPLGFGRYRQAPVAMRRMAWLIGTSAPALLGAGAAYFSLRFNGPPDVTIQVASDQGDGGMAGLAVY